MRKPTIQQAVNIVCEHNAWRRGQVKEFMIDSALLGQSLDVLVQYAVKKLQEEKK